VKLFKISFPDKMEKVLGKISIGFGKASTAPVGRVLTRQPGFLAIVVNDELLLLEAAGLEDIKSGDVVRIWDENSTERPPSDHINARLIASFKFEPERFSPEHFMKFVSLVSGSKLPLQTKKRILSAIDPGLLTRKEEVAKLGEELKRLSRVLSSVKPFGIVKRVDEPSSGVRERVGKHIVVIDEPTGKIFLAPKDLANVLVKNLTPPTTLSSSSGSSFTGTLTFKVVGKDVTTTELANNAMEAVFQRAGKMECFPGFATLEYGGKLEVFLFENVKDARLLLDMLPILEERASSSTVERVYTMETLGIEGSWEIRFLARETLLKSLYPILESLERDLKRSSPSLERSLSLLLERLIDAGNLPLRAVKSSRGWVWSFETPQGNVFSVAIKTGGTENRQTLGTTPSTTLLKSFPSGFISFRWDTEMDNRLITWIVKGLVESQEKPQERGVDMKDKLKDLKRKALGVQRIVLNRGNEWTRVEYQFNGSRKASMTFHGVRIDLERLSKFPSVRVGKAFELLLKLGSLSRHLTQRTMDAPKKLKLGRVEKLPANTATLRAARTKDPKRLFNLLRSALIAETMKEESKSEETAPSHISSVSKVRSTIAPERTFEGTRRIEDRAHVDKNVEDHPALRRIRQVLEEIVKKIGTGESPRTDSKWPTTLLDGFLVDGMHFLSFPGIGIRELWIRRWGVKSREFDRNERRYTAYIDVESFDYGRVRGLIDLTEMRLDVTLGMERELERARTKAALLKERMLDQYPSVRIQIVPMELVDSTKLFRRKGSFDVYA